ncbi:forkhead box protein k1 [Plakobranchus ocellatus]|uniref:Forkhead box protein k1 n=1 Tax=Plakobranchus ocellatus TaxID=259542 RepID=A0AAV3ZSM9_9GAST|nr:forkhead box protein k1 [Plakobranchus ocellatus]
MFVMAMMSIGKNYEDGEKLCASLNLPPPLSRNTWSSHMDKIHAANKCTAVESMNIATKEARGITIDDDSEDIFNTTVSCNGSWQRRGFASKNGVATVLTVGGQGMASKVVDTEVLSNFCHSCSLLKKNCQRQNLKSGQKIIREKVRKIMMARLVEWRPQRLKEFSAG